MLSASYGCADPQDENQKNPFEATYRGNNLHSGEYDSTNDPLPASEKWIFFSTEKGLDSSPAVANGLVYFGSHDQNFYALDAESGQERWKFSTGNIILSSPAVSEGTVYFGSMDRFFYALDAMTGEKKWSFETASSKKPPRATIPSYGIQSSPVLEDGIVYFGTFGDRLYALNAMTGAKIWEFEAPNEIMDSPAVADGVVFFPCLLKLFAVDAKTGKLIWEKEIQNGLGVTPVIADGLVLYDDGVNLSAYKCDTGELIWEIEVGMGGGLDYGPSVSDSVAFIGDSKGFYAVDVLTGKKIWENASIASGTGIPPSIAGNSVYFIDSQAYISAFDIENGELIGRYKFQPEFSPYWKTATSMAISNGIFYFGGKNGNMYAIASQE
ncbi:MAG: outer membrane protein assembly factor BamB family protein [Thermoleophilia bacterium]